MKLVKYCIIYSPKPTLHKVQCHFSFIYLFFQQAKRLNYAHQKWKLVRSRFFERPVKPVEKLVEFSFLV